MNNRSFHLFEHCEAAHLWESFQIAELTLIFLRKAFEANFIEMELIVQHYQLHGDPASITLTFCPRKSSFFLKVDAMEAQLKKTYGKAAATKREKLEKITAQQIKEPSSGKPDIGNS